MTRDMALQAFRELRYGRIKTMEINLIVTAQAAAAVAPLSVPEEEPTIDLAVNMQSSSHQSLQLSVYAVK